MHDYSDVANLLIAIVLMVSLLSAAVIALAMLIGKFPWKTRRSLRSKWRPEWRWRTGFFLLLVLVLLVATTLFISIATSILVANFSAQTEIPQDYAAIVRNLDSTVARLDNAVTLLAERLSDSHGRGEAIPGESGKLISYFLYFILAAVGLFLVAVLIRVFLPQKEGLGVSISRFFYALSTISVSLGGITLIGSIFNFNFEKIIIDGDGTPPGITGLELSGRLEIAGRKTEIECAINGMPVKIGPFDDGRVDDQKSTGKKTELQTFIANEAMQKSLKKALGWLRDSTKSGRHLAGFILVGSADARELGSALASTFGTNVGLAQTRALWVDQQLKTELSSITHSETPIVSIYAYAGPSVLDKPLTPERTERDRYVQVCALWE